MMIGHRFKLFAVDMLEVVFDENGRIILMMNIVCISLIAMTNTFYRWTANGQLTIPIYAMNHISFKAIQSNELYLNLRITSYSTYPIYPTHSVRSHPTNPIPTFPVQYALYDVLTFLSDAVLSILARFITYMM